ncbi:hypothetical protein DPMN_071248 [Dreissena polymorpha]|uniref:Ig-like domain-containing protein n=2 Tax=Dreissena polymorpha TaxID=45954 RepID=A0A9D3Z494_DREPO|nr:hypothetical protein DPMN_071248 [Dreissena polymorpha]
MLLSTLVLGAAITNCMEARGTPPILQGNNWPKPLEYIRKGNNRTFFCVATGSATLKYEWRFNGEKLNASEQEARFDANTGSLFIGEYFNEQLTGDYQCVVSNEFGTAMTPYFRIAATVANPFPNGDNMFPDNMDVYRSNYHKMDCINVPKSVPAWTFNWQRGKVLNTLSDAKPVNVSERMIIDPNGSLHFLWVEMSDDGYIYVCEAKNKITLTEVRNKHTEQLYVKESANERDRLPELKYSSDVTVIAGDTAELTCIFTYYSSRGEKLDITWTFNNTKVGNGSTLRLPNIKVPDKDQNNEGEYMCFAKLGLHKQVWGKVNLKITAPPEFVPAEKPARLFSPVDKDATFHCRATSYKAYQGAPVWMINGKPLIGCPPFFFDCGQPIKGYSGCIPIKQFCNSNRECPDNADEINCPRCPEGTKQCNGPCILNNQTCVACEFPSFSCDQGEKCLQHTQICDGIAQCADEKDEEGCAGKASHERGKFRLNSQRTQLTIPRAQKTDVMCVQCLVSNKYGKIFGDGCLTVIDKIKIKKAPNARYDVEPNMKIVIAIDAITDPDWQNQTNYEWFWYLPVTTQTDDNIKEKQQLPPTSSYGKYFKLLHSGKELTFTIPDVKTPVMEGNTAEYDLYQNLTDNRLFSINISHKFDHQVVNFTVKGKELEKPKHVSVANKAGFNLWFIALIVGIPVVFIVVVL